MLSSPVNFIDKSVPAAPFQRLLYTIFSLQKAVQVASYQELNVAFPFLLSFLPSCCFLWLLRPLGQLDDLEQNGYTGNDLPGK
jgi:hypothetical protein